MAPMHKPVKPSKPSGIRLTAEERRDAKRATEIERKRTGRNLWWTRLVADVGMRGIRRILRRAEKAEGRSSTLGEVADNA